MIFKYEVQVEVSLVSGKKESNGAIADALQTTLQDTDPEELEVEESTYQVDNWSVTDKTFAGINS